MTRLCSFDVELLGGLPGEVGVVSAEVAVGGGLLVDGSEEVELLDDVAWAEVEVLLHDLNEVLVSAAAGNGAVGLDVDREGVSEADGIGDLDEDSVAEASGDEGLSHIASVVGGRSVDLGGVLAGEGTTTVGGPTTVGIDDDLSAGETGVSLGATNDEGARGVDDDVSVLEHLSGADLLDDLLDEGILNLLLGDGGIVLGGDENVVDSHGLDLAVFVGVLNNNLRLAIGSQPGDLTGVSSLGHLLAEEVGEVVRVGVEGDGVPLVGGIAEHDTLVTSTEVVHIFLNVDGLSDLWALSLYVDEDGHGLVVESLVLIVIADLLGDLTGNLLVVDGGAVNEGLTEEADHLGLGGRLEANLAVLVLSEASVENSVGDLIAELVGVTLTD